MKKLMIYVAVIFSLFIASNASALLTETFYLNIGNTSTPGISGYPLGYAQVTASMTGPDVNLVTITFTGLDYHGVLGNYDYDLWGKGLIGLNLKDVNVAYSITSTIPAPRDIILGSAGNEDGFGDFNFQLNKDSGGASYAIDEITVVLTKVNGDWHDLSDVFLPNQYGYIAAAHIYVFNSAGCNVATGYATGAPPTETLVPEPGTVLLLGFGLLGVAGMRRFRK